MGTEPLSTNSLQWCPITEVWQSHKKGKRWCKEGTWQRKMTLTHSHFDNWTFKKTLITEKITFVYIHFSMIYEKKAFENILKHIFWKTYHSNSSASNWRETQSWELSWSFLNTWWLDLKHLVFTIRKFGMMCFVKILTAMIANKIDKFYILLQSLPQKISRLFPLH